MEKTLKSWLKQLKLHESTISMVLGALVVVVVGSLLYNYFTGIGEDSTGEISDEAAVQEYTLELTEEEEGKIVPQGLPISHTVSKGEHLWSISEKYYGNGYNWVDIAEVNGLNNPGMIETGQQLRIPKVELRVPPTKEMLAQQPESDDAIGGSQYTVVKGDTLWNIAVQAYRDGYQWPKIYQANNSTIEDPNVIEVGMQLAIPREP